MSEVTLCEAYDRLCENEASHQVSMFVLGISTTMSVCPEHLDELRKAPMAVIDVSVRRGVYSVPEVPLALVIEGEVTHER